MSFESTAQYYETQPCDRPGAKHDQTKARQDLLDERANIQDEMQDAANMLEFAGYLPNDIKKRVEQFYKDELARIDAEIENLKEA